MPAHGQAPDLCWATARRSQAEADVGEAAARREGEGAVTEVAATSLPGVKREADLAHLERRVGRRPKRDARLGGMHEEHDSGRSEREAAKDNPRHKGMSGHGWRGARTAAT